MGVRVRVFTWMAALGVAAGTLVGAAGPVAAADQNVRIEGSQFRPGLARISVGEAVIWRNYDGDQHRVEADEGSPIHFDSGDLDRDEQFAKAFDRAGTFRYHCRIHDSMTGAVEVAEAGATTTTAPPPTTTTAPPTTTTTEPPTTTTEPPTTTTSEPPTTTTGAPPPAEPSTSTTRVSTSTTTSTTVPGESTTTSSSTSSTSSTSTTVTTVAAPVAAPPDAPPPGLPTDPLPGEGLGPAGRDGAERDRGLVGSASGTLSPDDGPGPWMVLGLILFAAVALFGVWNLWNFRPSRT